MKKTLVVVGAGRGLGNAIAGKFAANDFRVALVARSEDRLAAYKTEMESKGVEVYTHTADASDIASLTAALEAVKTKWGTPDVLAYNVGITAPDAAQEGGIGAKTLLSRYQADVAGAFHCIQQVATDAFTEKGGAILITGGGLAMYPSADYLPLSMDKAALRTMVQALYPVMKGKGIFIGTVMVCGAIQPGTHFAPELIAETFWKMYVERKDWELRYE